MSSITKTTKNKQCRVESCAGRGQINRLTGERGLIKGYCVKHYKRMTRNQPLTSPSRFELRPAVIEGDIAKIPLGVNAKDGYAIVDKDFAHLADEANWCKSWHGYAVGRYDNKLCRMHHLIVGKTPAGLVVDHINRNKLDNRSGNLRTTTQSKNMLNVGMRKDNKTGHRNISLANNVYTVYIRRNNKVLFNARYKTINEAVLSRDKVLRQIGERV